MSSNLNYKQVANVKRRTWDIEAYEQKATARAEAQEKEEAAGSSFGGKKHKGGKSEEESLPKRVKESEDVEDKEEFTPAEPGAAGPIGSKRSFLKPRRNKVDVDSKVGSTEIISAEAAAKTSLSSADEKDVITKSGVGWHCSVCDCFLKDSMTYLDHINGRKHQRKLGYSMRVERSTKDQMLGRLSQLAKEKERTEKKDEIVEDVNYAEIVKAKDEEEAKRREEKRKLRKEKKKEKKESASQLKAMEKEEEEEEDAKGEEIELEEESVDPVMAAMMGFSGFGQGNKN